MEDLILIQVNDRVWSECEKEEIFVLALQKFKTKSRKVKMTSSETEDLHVAPFPLAKKPRLESETDHTY